MRFCDVRLLIYSVCSSFLQIHSCAKMSYKAGYDASYLLEPSTNRWTPFKQCKPLLDANEQLTQFSSNRADAASPLQQYVQKEPSTTTAPQATTSSTNAPSATSDSDEEWDDDDESEGDDDDEASLSFPNPFPGALQPEDLPHDLIMALKVIEGRTARPFLMTSVADSSDRRRELLECVGALGPDVSERAFFYIA